MPSNLKIKLLKENINKSSEKGCLNTTLKINKASPSFQENIQDSKKDMEYNENNISKYTTDRILLSTTYKESIMQSSKTKTRSI